MSRQIGMLHPTDEAPLTPDTVTTFLMTGGSSTQASDWFSSTSGAAAANAAAAGIGMIRVNGFTTAGVALPIGLNISGAAAVVPTSGTSMSSAADVTIQMNGTARFYQVPGGSTGYSISAVSSGIVSVEHWRK